MVTVTWCANTKRKVYTKIQLKSLIPGTGFTPESNGLSPFKIRIRLGRMNIIKTHAKACIPYVEKKASTINPVTNAIIYCRDLGISKGRRMRNNK
jgi:hypothetical protein